MADLIICTVITLLFVVLFVVGGWSAVSGAATGCLIGVLSILAIFRAFYG